MSSENITFPSSDLQRAQKLRILHWMEPLQGHVCNTLWESFYFLCTENRYLKVTLFLSRQLMELTALSWQLKIGKQCWKTSFCKRHLCRFKCRWLLWKCNCVSNEYCGIVLFLKHLEEQGGGRVSAPQRNRSGEKGGEEKMSLLKYSNPKERSPLLICCTNANVRIS